MVLPLSTTMEVREEQLAKAKYPMLVTLLGMVIDVNDLHPSNALSPILVTLLGIIVF